MIEVVGDSSRDGEVALVRLAVEGDRIVDADTDGLGRPLRGLTLLEAAAVPGETLAADALANALSQVFRAEPDPGRVAVAMSGGVDSAVALLRGGPQAVGVTLRLWIDPEAPDSERACCSPEAVIAARETCHALGLPHVTLDLREEFRRAVVAPFVRGYARGETPNPCIRCNGSFRFAELLAFAERAGASRPATGHYRDFLGRHGVEQAEGEILDEQGRRLGSHDGFWRFTPGQRRGIGVAAGKPLYVLRTDSGANAVVVGPRESLAVETISARGRLYVRVNRAEVKWRYRSPAVPAAVEETEHGFRLVLDAPAYGVAVGQAAVLYEDDVVVGAGVL